MRSVLLVEGIPLFRRGIRTSLERSGEWTVFESVDRVEIMELAQGYQPTCAILDGGLATLDPLESCWALRQLVPQIGILILAPSPDEEQCFRYFERGANAYELRTISSEALVDRIQRMSRGEYLITSETLPPRPSARIAPALKTHRHGGLDLARAQEEPVSTFPLSGREVEILDYVARGNSNKEIAKALKISDQTVKNHITSILQKLSMNDRTSAVVYALRHSWISLESLDASRNVTDRDH